MQPTKAECLERIAKYRDDPMCRQALDYFIQWLEFHNGVAKAPEDDSASADLYKTEMMELKDKERDTKPKE